MPHVDVISKVGIHEARSRQGCISQSFHFKRPFNSCILVIKWSASILKVGVVPMYQVLKRKVS